MRQPVRVLRGRVILDVLDAPRTLLVDFDNRTSTSIGTLESCQNPTSQDRDDSPEGEPTIPRVG
jgi:hypothetical protein